MNTILVFIKRDWLIYKSYKLQIVLQYLSLFSFLVLVYFLSKLMVSGSNSFLSKYNGDYSSFLIVGILFQWFSSTSLNSFSKSIREEQTLGTLEFLLFCPKSLILLLVGASAYNYIKLFAQSAFMLLSMRFLLGIEISPNILPAIFVIILLILSLSGIGFISAGITLAFKKGNPIGWIFSTLSTFLSGVFFPVEMLPPGLLEFSSFLPTTHALNALRELLILNSNLYSLTPEIFSLTCFSVVSLSVGIYSFNVGFEYARIKGTLSSY
ncbi:MAG: ABC transporter permease [Melioribacteraceae bacterium]|nr:ABC transporter permease [Melioribacteraceae bacterium]